MSAIGAIFNFNRRPFDDGDLRDLTALWRALQKWGPDGGRIVTSDSCGVCYRAFNTNSESEFEVQPVVGADGTILAADLRLDNREELFAATHRSLPQSSLAQTTDAELAVAVCRVWGADFPLHLIGEYAVLVYEPRAGRLLLCRDHIGAPPLYYHRDHDRLIASSQLAPLLDVFPVCREIDEEYVAGCMSRGPTIGLTPYKHIHAVRPAHVVSASAAGDLRERRFWKLDVDAEIRFDRDEEYEEAFRYHLRNAVRAPLRSNRSLLIELSGGLDSSTIACLADESIREGNVPANRYDTVSYVYDESPTSDESKFIHCVEDHLGCVGIHVKDEECSLLPPADQTLDIVTPNPILYSYGYHAALCRLMRETGARVLLTGVGGDQVLGSSYDPYPELADLLVLKQLFALHRRVQTWSETLQKPYLWLLWQKTLVPVLPRRVQPLFRRAAMKRVPAWVNAAFVAKTKLRENELPPADPFGFRLPSDRDKAISYLAVIKNVAPCHRREMTPLDSSYPFMHRPLVEFLQAIPFTQLLRPGENRSLMRRALRDLLPEKVARRKTKGIPTEGLCRAVAREWQTLRSLFAESRVCAYGFMDSAPLLAAIDRSRNGLEVFNGALLTAISLEFWLRALEQRPAAKRDATLSGSTRAAVANAGAPYVHTAVGHHETRTGMVPE